MPEKVYKVFLEDIIYIHVNFITEKGKVKHYIVKLIFIYNDIKYEVARFDSAHGWSHIDFLYPDKTVYRKIWLYEKDYEDALSSAIIELKKNYDNYIKRFKEWLKKEKKTSKQKRKE